MGRLRALLLTLLVLLPGVGAAGLVWSEGSAQALGIGALFSLVTGGLTLALDRLWRVTTHRHAQAIRTLGDSRTPLSQEPQPAALAEVLGAVTELDARWQQRSASLRQEASTLSATLEGMAEGVWITDRHGGLLRVNRALREMLFSTRPLVGERAMNLFKSAQLEAAVLRACTEGHSSTLELGHQGLRPRLLSVFVTPLGGDLPGSAAVFRDITELRRLEKVRKDFVANVSHELRTPITAIRGYAETLQNGALQDAVMAPRMVEIIHRQSERLSELVEDLLEISHLEGQELQLELEPVDLWTATQRALDTVRVRATTKRIQLELDVPEGILVQGDTRAVEQVLLNLMDNAVKYSPEGGQVFIRAWEDGDCARVAVRDTGYGMEAKHLARIFERFYRVDKGRSRDMGGTGLGLSIVKHLVGAMKGEVEVASTLNVGTTFTLTLSKADAPMVDAG